LNDIVLIENDEALREALTDALQLEGFKVVQACDGRQGLEILQEHPDSALVLLDLAMPVMSGWQFLEAMRQDSRLSALPVIAMSATRHQTAPAGTHGILQKPMSLDILLGTVAHYVRRIE
jgi:CheY-like chemotaxis protein